MQVKTRVMQQTGDHAGRPEIQSMVAAGPQIVSN